MRLRLVSMLMVVGLIAGFVPNPVRAAAYLYPTSGSTSGGTVVTIYGGTGYTVATTVSLCGVTRAVTTAASNGTSVTFITPPCAAGLQAVTTANPPTVDGLGFSYTAVVPVTPWYSPASGSAGTMVTLNAPGQGAFTGATTVTVGGVAAPQVLATSSTTLMFEIPSLGTVAGAKAVETANPATTGLPTFAYTSPTPISMSPTTGPTGGGTVVQLSAATGSFDGGCLVRLAATSTTDVIPTTIGAYGNYLTFVTPAGTAGAVTVSIVRAPTAPAASCAADGSIAGTFTYSGSGGGGSGTPYLSPSSGPAGTVIQIWNGYGFTGATSISICSLTVSPTTIATGGTSLTFVAPTCLLTTPLTISTTNPTYPIAGTFTYTPGTVTPPVVYPPSTVAAPIITSVSPNTGSRAGGNTVTITGYNFLSGATVVFGATSATGVTYINPTALTATVPAGVGPVAVTVRNPDGQSGQLPNAYTYADTGYVCGNASALNITTTGPFTTSTKVATVNQYVTFAMGCGAAAAGQKLTIYRATKSSSGVWSSFTPYTSRIANAGGAVYYNVRSASSAWWSFFVQIAGVVSPARQARWQ